MNRADALAELIAKVEAGGASNDGSMFRAFGDKWTLCYDAFHGSLDAALVLHQAVLPGWQVKRFKETKNKSWFVCLEPLPYFSPNVISSSATPARAWLLAILKALHAMEVQL